MFNHSTCVGLNRHYYIICCRAATATAFPCVAVKKTPCEIVWWFIYKRVLKMFLSLTQQSTNNPPHSLLNLITIIMLQCPLKSIAYSSIVPLVVQKVMWCNSIKKMNFTSFPGIHTHSFTCSDETKTHVCSNLAILSLTER